MKSPCASRAVLIVAAMTVWLALPAAARAGEQTAADCRHQAEQAIAAGRYADGAALYRAEAAIYERIGDKNAASVERQKADRWETRIQVFADASPNRDELLGSFTNAKYEPLYGCYLSAYVSSDAKLDANVDIWTTEASRLIDRAGALGRLLGKPLASSWNYCRWGQEFPAAWAIGLAKAGVAPQVALEPDSLASVVDDEYLEEFAHGVADVRAPVFIRFASEMNGNWTTYHDNPALYREKFRLVHDVFARIAPNAAMIWCVNAIPDTNYDAYYPGDDSVDWVGVNIYSVIHHDNDPSRSATEEHPTAQLRKVYEKYATRKPIAICEFGSSHQEALDREIDYSPIAAEKIHSLLAALPRLFPRVKMVGFFNCDNLTAQYVPEGRQLNNYSITDNPVVLNAVNRAVAPSYFLSHINKSPGSMPATVVRAVSPDAVLCTPLRISSCVQSYSHFPVVVTLVDGVEVGRIADAGPHLVELLPGSVSAGHHTLEVRVYDDRNRLAGSKSTPFVLSASGTSIASASP
ncbi:MAG: glycosyl hydrolase [Capsulimonadaceae bacterium]|nr:glycosyl hydrolase [Capsulimonadaceae bacterium]